MVALVLGVLLGALLPAAAPPIAWIGEIFVRLIRMLVVPVVFFSIAAGVIALADPARLGSLGGRAVLLFMGTTVVAVAVGIAVALLLQPGVGVSFGAAVPTELGTSKTIVEQLVGIVPLNVFDMLAKGDMLPIIFVAVLVGIGTLIAGEEGRPIAAIFTAGSAVMLRVVRVVMEVAPFGVFALIANAIAINGTAVLVHVGRLAVGVVLGSLVQMLIVHVLLLVLIARFPPIRFFRGIFDALVIAFSTSSSSATLPVAMRVAEENLGVSRVVAATVLPLGASIGKDGTAMYVGLLAIFSLQAFGVPLTASTLAMVWLTGALAAFGTAPAPSASLFMLATVLSAVGVAPANTALIVGFILPFDRLLDMTRTVPSACANLAVATTVARLEGELASGDPLAGGDAGHRRAG